jgi:hypothetical protein
MRRPPHPGRALAITDQAPPRPWVAAAPDQANINGPVNHSGAPARRPFADRQPIGARIAAVFGALAWVSGGAARGGPQNGLIGVRLRVTGSQFGGWLDA